MPLLARPLTGILACPAPCAVLCLQTTLLSILGGRAPKLTKQDGRATFNGSKLNKRVKRQIGFVLQASGRCGFWDRTSCLSGHKVSGHKDSYHTLCHPTPLVFAFSAAGRSAVLHTDGARDAGEWGPARWPAQQPHMAPLCSQPYAAHLAWGRHH